MVTNVPTARNESCTPMSNSNMQLQEIKISAQRNKELTELLERFILVATKHVIAMKLDLKTGGRSHCLKNADCKLEILDVRCVSGPSMQQH